MGVKVVKVAEKENAVFIGAVKVPRSPASTCFADTLRTPAIMVEKGGSVYRTGVSGVGDVCVRGWCVCVEGVLGWEGWRQWKRNFGCRTLLEGEREVRSGGGGLFFLNGLDVSRW